jgi:hypothetical protein
LYRSGHTYTYAAVTMSVMFCCVFVVGRRQEMEEYATVMPAVDQLELHPRYACPGAYPSSSHLCRPEPVSAKDRSFARKEIVRNERTRFTR